MDQVAIREQLGAAYAAGMLEPAMQLLVETQAILRPDAAEDLRTGEILVGALLEAETPVALGPSAFDGVFARCLKPEPDEASAAAAQRSAARRAGAVIEEILGLPRPVQEVALEAIGRGGWTFAGPGMRTLSLALGGPAQAEILRIEPGWGAPRHAHRGGEFTLVLTGAFGDERGRYRAGDIAYGGPGITHRPVAEPGEVCYALAVSEGAPVFTGALGLLQKIWRH